MNNTKIKLRTGNFSLSCPLSQTTLNVQHRHTAKALFRTVPKRVYYIIFTNAKRYTLFDTALMQFDVGKWFSILWTNINLIHIFNNILCSWFIFSFIVSENGIIGCTICVYTITHYTHWIGNLPISKCNGILQSIK